MYIDEQPEIHGFVDYLASVYKRTRNKAHLHLEITFSYLDGQIVDLNYKTSSFSITEHVAERFHSFLNSKKMNGYINEIVSLVEPMNLASKYEGVAEETFFQRNYVYLIIKTDCYELENENIFYRYKIHAKMGDFSG